MDRDRIPFRPDWKKFKQLERLNIARWMSARTEAGTLVGYTCWIISPSLHYRDTVHALNDAIYIAPEHRKGWNGINMLDTCERALYALGVTKIVYHTKVHVLFGHGKGRGTLGRLLQRRGYKTGEHMFYKLVR